MEEVWEEIRPLSQLQLQLQQRNPTALTLGSVQPDGYCGTNAAAVAIFTNSCFNNYPPCGPHSGTSTEQQANYCAKRRALEQQHLDHGLGLGLDHRKKRLIKNRESAARSRARKQAYTNELEQEVAHLLDENSRLRRQYEELRLIMATQAPTKRTLHRASSAPI